MSGCSRSWPPFLCVPSIKSRTKTPSQCEAAGTDCLVLDLKLAFYTRRKSHNQHSIRELKKKAYKKVYFDIINVVLKPKFNLIFILNRSPALKTNPVQCSQDPNPRTQVYMIQTPKPFNSLVSPVLKSQRRTKNFLSLKP